MSPDSENQRSVRGGNDYYAPAESRLRDVAAKNLVYQHEPLASRLARITWRRPWLCAAVVGGAGGVVIGYMALLSGAGAYAVVTVLVYAPLLTLVIGVPAVALVGWISRKRYPQTAREPAAAALPTAVVPPLTQSAQSVGVPEMPVSAGFTVSPVADLAELDRLRAVGALEEPEYLLMRAHLHRGGSA